MLLWLVAAAAATAVGMTAVSAIGTDLFGGGGDPLSESEVDEQLRSTSPTTESSSEPTSEPTTTTPGTSSTPAPPPTARGVSIPTPGGTVIARCEAAGVRVLQTMPAQGFLAEADDDDVDDHPSVKFQSGDREVEVRLRCVNGVPRGEVEED